MNVEDLQYDPRQTASEWHDGQFSALYAFASSGAVVPGASDEAAKNVAMLDAGYDPGTGEGPAGLLAAATELRDYLRKRRVARGFSLGRGGAAYVASLASGPLATIVVMEQSSAYDDYDTENGIGHADAVELYEVEGCSIEADELEGRELDDVIQARLDDFGVGQWDGGNVAYDPDGSHMAPDGTITTRYAVVSKS
jgi:hypothetical protein